MSNLKAIEGRTIDKQKLPDKSDVKKRSAFENFWANPHTLLGSMFRKKREVEILVRDENDIMTIQKVNSDFPPGLETVVKEIINNMTDNFYISVQAGVDPGKMKVYMGRNTIIATNEGYPFEVEWMEEHGKYKPDLLLGDLNTSTNYFDRHTESTKDRKGSYVGSRFGVGGSACNAMCTYFEIEIYDSVNHKYFRKAWKGKLEPVDGELGIGIVKDYDGMISSTKITFIPNLVEFGYLPKDPIPGHFYDNIGVMLTKSSLTSKAPVEFYINRTKDDFTKELCEYYYFDYKDIREFSKLYFNGTLPKHKVLYDVRRNDIQVHKDIASDNDEVLKLINKLHVIPDREIIIFDVTQKLIQSFVNGICTPRGGAHVNPIHKILLQPLIEDINNMIVGKKEAKAKTGKKDDGEKLSRLNIKDAENRFACIVVSRVMNPIFSNMEKSQLDGNDLDILIPDSFQKEFRTWSIYDTLCDDLDNRNLKKMKEKDKVGKNRRYNTDFLIDANYAGSKDSSKCTLWITEGKAGLGYPGYIMNNITDAPYYHGRLALKGKPPNTINKKEREIDANKEFTNIINALGLEPGMDYSLPENRKKLRYGRINITVDADDDGFHILGLVYIFFMQRYHTLLNCNFIYWWRSAVLRVYKDGKWNCFLSSEEFECKKDDYKNARLFKYAKGLGSNSEADAKIDFQNNRCPQLFINESGYKSLLNCFHIAYSDKRKWMIISEDKSYIEGSADVIQMEDFNNKVLVGHMRDNCKRCIPRLDGLKEVQSMILNGALHTYPIKNNKITKNGESDLIKVSQLAARAANDSAYHHGETSMCEAIFVMAANYVTGNNVHLFKTNGFFGDRLQNGSNHAPPRYPFLALDDLAATVLKDIDLEICERFKEEGKFRQPKNFPFIIPYAVNGFRGIATGWNTFAFPINPLDTANWLAKRCKITKERCGEPPPYWLGHTGEIIKLPDDMAAKKAIKRQLMYELDEDDDETDTIGKYFHTYLEKENKQYLMDGKTQEEKESIMNKIVDAGMTKESKNAKRVSYYDVRGAFKEGKNNTIIIDELPPGISKLQYKKFLEKELIDKGKIKSFDNVGKDDDARFIIHKKPKPVEPKNPTEEQWEEYAQKVQNIFEFNDTSLRLIRTFSTNNMSIFYEDSIKKFYCWMDYLDFYYLWRIEGYHKRKQHILDTLKEKEKELTEKAIIVQAVVHEKLLLFNNKQGRAIADVKRDIVNELKVDSKYIDQIKASGFTKEEYEKMMNEVADIKAKIEQVEKTPCEDTYYSELKEFAEMYKKVNKERNAKQTYYREPEFP